MFDAVKLLDLAMAACEEADNLGYCTECGEEHSGIEPDACEYVCESCGADAVCGAEEIVLMYA